jgi:hypothetical protein
MKTCFKCKISKDLLDFSKNPKRPDGLNSQCKNCHKEYRKLHYEANKKKYIKKAKKWRKTFCNWVDTLKMAPCVDCKIQYPPYVMDFDHLHDKEFTISSVKADKGKQKVLDEIKKCELVCSNCHRIRTHKRLQEKKNQACII